MPATLSAPISSEIPVLTAIAVLTLLAAVTAIAVMAIRAGSRRMSADLRSALDCAPANLAFFDRHDRLLFWNERYAELITRYGLTIGRGLPLAVILEGAKRTGLPEAIGARALERVPIGETRKLEPFLGATGRWLQVQMRGTREGGRMVVMADITEEHQVAEREAEARLAAQAANEAKSSFVANMSHEIRTPLNGVLGMVQVMGLHPLSPDQRKRLEVIDASGKSLLAVLNSVLDLSKIEAGKLEREDHVFDLTALVEAVAEPIRETAEQKGLALRLEHDAALAGAWEGDSGKIRQIIANLLSNALKFTTQGEVLLSVATTPQGVAFAVRDSGIGIPADKLDAIFEKFTQADASTTRRFGGTGLGLSICRDLVAFLGGELGVTSVEGEGSTFSFTLPLERAAEAPAAEEPGPAPRESALRILAAEDNPTNRLILQALLESLGVTLVLTDDGGPAIAAFEKGGFDLILMDAQMPVVSGEEAARAIRAIERREGRRRTPILALTADVMRHQVEAYLEAGMDGFVAKPIEMSALIGAIDMALAGETPMAAVA